MCAWCCFCGCCGCLPCCLPWGACASARAVEWFSVGGLLRSSGREEGADTRRHTRSVWARAYGGGSLGAKGCVTPPTFAGWKEQAHDALMRSLPGAPGQGPLVAVDAPYLEGGRIAHPPGSARVKLPFGIQPVVDANMEKLSRVPRFHVPLADLKKHVDKQLLSLEGVRRMYAGRAKVAAKYGCAHPTRDEPAHEVHAALVMEVLAEFNHNPPASLTEEMKRDRWWQALEAIDRLEMYRWESQTPWDALGGRVSDSHWGILLTRLQAIFEGEAPPGKAKEPRRSDNPAEDPAVAFVHKKLKTVGVLADSSTVGRWEVPGKRAREGAPPPGPRSRGEPRDAPKP